MSDQIDPVEEFQQHFPDDFKEVGIIQDCYREAEEACAILRYVPGASGPAFIDLVFPNASYSGILPGRLALLSPFGWQVGALPEDTSEAPAVKLKPPARDRKAN